MEKSRNLLVVAVMVILLAGVPVLADPVTVSLSPTNDTDIQSNIGYDLDHEKVLKSFVSGTTIRRSLLMFDFTDQIPEGMVIVEAQMDLRPYAASNGDDSIDIYRASGTGVDSWYEGGGINWAGQTSWTYDLAESDVVGIAGITRYIWDLDLNYVEEGIMTFGLLHKEEFGASGLADPVFNAKEKWGAVHGPWMHVTYDIPEPATMTLLLLGLPLALRRRRK